MLTYQKNGLWIAGMLLLLNCAWAGKPVKPPKDDGPANPEYDAVDLGLVHHNCAPVLNDDGEAVLATVDAESSRDPVYLLLDGEGTIIKTLALPHFENGDVILDASATGINDSGGIVGFGESPDDGQSLRGLFWQLTYGPETITASAPLVLPPLPGHSWSLAGDVNNGGIAVGVSVERRAAQSGQIEYVGHPVAWRIDVLTLQVTDMCPLPVLAEGDSEVSAINDAGRAVGALGDEAARWDILEVGGLLVVSEPYTFGLLDDCATVAVDINQSGDICGRRASTLAGAWLSTDGFTMELQSYVRKFRQHEALGLSNRNPLDPDSPPDVVGTAQHSTWGYYTAFLWRAGQVFDLKKAVSRQTRPPELQRAWSTSIDGRVLCTGRIEPFEDQIHHLYVLVPK